MISLIVIVPKLGEACVCIGDSEVQINGCGQAGGSTAFSITVTKFVKGKVLNGTLIPAKQLDLLIILHICLRSLTLVCYNSTYPTIGIS